MNFISAFLIGLGLVTQPVKAPLFCFKDCLVSESGYQIVRDFEGYMPFPYKDVAGINTVGYGHVIRPGDKFKYPLLPDDANNLLKATMRAFERDINKLVMIMLSQNQFDAVASFTYNVGSGALKGSTLLKRINAKRHEDVRGCFLMWNKATINGVRRVVNGLTIRRQAEASLYERI